MARLEQNEISCGVRDLSGVRDDPPEKVLYDALRNEGGWYFTGQGTRTSLGNYAIVLFSDRIDRAPKTKYRTNGGVAVAKYITDNRLGKIIPSDIIVNPNSQNKIRVWMWQVNRPTLQKWFTKHIKERDGQDLEIEEHW